MNIDTYELRQFLAKSKEGNLIKLEDIETVLTQFLMFLDGMLLNANLKSDINTIEIIKERFEQINPGI